MRGGKLFQDLACSSCHLDSGQGRGPSLKDIVGTTVSLQDGTTATVDEAYLRESILNSQAKIVKGFQPLMPTFQGLVSEENLVALIEHVKSLSPKATTTAATTTQPISSQIGNRPNEATKPATKSRLSPGRKKPISKPVSANTMAMMPTKPTARMSSGTL